MGLPPTFLRREEKNVNVFPGKRREEAV